MAPEGGRRLLPIPCGSRKSKSTSCFWSAPSSAVVPSSLSPQPEGGALGSPHIDLRPLDSGTSRLASLSHATLLRHSSKVGAVCVNAHVRICAGGDQRCSSIPHRNWR